MAAARVGLQALLAGLVGASSWWDWWDWLKWPSDYRSGDAARQSQSAYCGWRTALVPGRPCAMGSYKVFQGSMASHARSLRRLPRGAHLVQEAKMLCLRAQECAGFSFQNDPEDPKQEGIYDVDFFGRAASDLLIDNNCWQSWLKTTDGRMPHAANSQAGELDPTLAVEVVSLGKALESCQQDDSCHGVSAHDEPLPLYLPFSLDGKPVLREESSGVYLVDESELAEPAAAGLEHRRQPNLESLHGTSVAWGSMVSGRRLAGPMDWLELGAVALDYEARFAYRCHDRREPSGVCHTTFVLGDRASVRTAEPTPLDFAMRSVRPSASQVPTPAPPPVGLSTAPRPRPTPATSVRPRPTPRSQPTPVPLPSEL